MISFSDLKSNTWKLLLYTITQRRNFLPILAIYFLTLPNSTAQQIGIYTGIGTLASFLLEIPTGYFSDHFGHKKTLIISKLMMLGSTISFLFAHSIVEYTIGSVLLSFGFAFQSGTFSAFLHDTLSSTNREKEYAKISGKMSANASLVSMALILALPSLTTIDIRGPLIAGVALDVLGLFLSFSLVNPPKEAEHRALPRLSILELLREAKNSGILPFSIFTGLIGAVLLGAGGYREVLLQSIGYPLVFIGTVMGLSRLVWFVVGHRVHYLEKISLQKILLAEMFLFPLSFILISQLKNPFLVGILFIVPLGYFWGREQLLEGYFIRHYIRKPKYKATLLSIDSQIGLFFQTLASFAFGFLMKDSFTNGYLVMGIVLFVLLAITYPLLIARMKRDAKTQNA